MRGRLLAAAASLLLLGAVAVAVAPAPPAQGASHGPAAAALEVQLVCPTCKTTLDMSDAPVARRMKAYLRTRLAQGASADQIKRELVAQFGPGVLSVPGTRGFDLLAWLLPLGGLVLGATVVGLLAWSWSRSRAAPPGPEPPLDPRLERRVDEELVRLER